MLLLLCFILPSLCFAEPVENKEKEEKTKKKPPKIGNFTLPSPQRPGPFLSFGERNLNENQAQLELFTDYFSGDSRHLTEFIPGYLYGITDDIVVSVALPITPSNKAFGYTSSGLEDGDLQLEYAYYTHATTRYEESATVVGNVTFPSGSAHKNPRNGVGSASFFLGGTYSLMYPDWFGFLSDGVLMTTRNHQTKVGNTFFYQAGFGRNIFSIPSELTLAWLAEFNGLYVQKTKINDKKNPDTGSNTLYLTPSLQLCTPDIILILGIGFPIFQHVNGNQTKINYLLASDLIWTF